MIKSKNIFLTSFSKKGSLKNSFIWSFLGNLIFLGCQWLIMLILARKGTPFIAGQYALALGFVMPVIAVCQMQLSQLQITDIKKEHSLKDYFVFRSIALLFGFLLILFLTIVFRSTDIKLIIFLFLAKSFESLGEVVYGYLQSSEKFKELAFIKIFRGIAIILTVIICISAKFNLFKITIAISLISFLIFLFVEYRLVFSIIRKNSFGKWAGFKVIFITAFPLGLSSGLNSVTTNLPRYFLNYYYGKEVVGYFSVIYSPITWLALIPNVMNQVILPKASYFIQNNQLKEYIIIIIKYTVVISVFFAIVVLVFNLWGEQLLGLLFGFQYAKYSNLLKILSVSLLIANVGCIGPYTVSASRSFWLQFSAVFLSFIIMIIGCFVFSKSEDWIIIGWVEVVREFIVIIYYLLITYLILSKINRSQNKIL